MQSRYIFIYHKRKTRIVAYNFLNMSGFYGWNKGGQWFPKKSGEGVEISTHLSAPIPPQMTGK